MADLKPCPFCGGKAEMTTAIGEAWVYCPACDGSASMEASEEKAAKAWNRRNTDRPGIVVACGGRLEQEAALLLTIKDIGFEHIIIADEKPKTIEMVFKLPELTVPTILRDRESNAERCGYSTKRK